MRIAYVEDNPTNFMLIERVAGMAQHTLVSYAEGEIALVALKTELFDLILMDVELAGEMSGLDLVRALRKSGLQTPIVAVTAYAMLGDRERCLEAGCNEYLPKPIPIMDMVATFAKYAELAKANASAMKPETDKPTVPPSAAAPSTPPTPAAPPSTASSVSGAPSVKPDFAGRTLTSPIPTEVIPPAIKTFSTTSAPVRGNTKPFTFKTNNVVDN